jgi:hypothetical protein
MKSGSFVQFCPGFCPLKKGGPGFCPLWTNLWLSEFCPVLSGVLSGAASLPDLGWRV